MREIIDFLLKSTVWKEEESNFALEKAEKHYFSQAIVTIVITVVFNPRPVALD